jgi:hypothetical protein
MIKKITDKVFSWGANTPSSETQGISSIKPSTRVTSRSEIIQDELYTIIADFHSYKGVKQDIYLGVFDRKTDLIEYLVLSLSKYIHKKIYSRYYLYQISYVRQQ